MASAREKAKFKWEPSPMVKPQDNIKSSSFANSKPFIPSYDTESKVDMGYLMSMEYAKIWRKEREELAKPVVENTKCLPKKFVVRGLNKKKQELKKNEQEQNKIIKPSPSKQQKSKIPPKPK